MTSKEKYTLLDKLNLCHRCQKKRPLVGRKYCPECIEKYINELGKKYDPIKAREYLPRKRELYHEKKKNGICVRCSKTATHGIYCYECSIKVKKYSQEENQRRKIARHERGLITEYRKNNKLCLRCGEPLDTNGSKLCVKCCEENRKNSLLADKSHWHALEKERYERNKKWRDKNGNHE